MPRDPVEKNAKKQKLTNITIKKLGKASKNKKCKTLDIVQTLADPPPPLYGLDVL